MMEKQMLVHASYGRYHKAHPDCPLTVPMGLLNEKWAQTNHGQSLDRLNERGGLSPMEMICIIEQRRCIPYRETKTEQEWIDKLKEYVTEYLTPDTKNK